MTDARDSNTDRISEPTPLKPIVVSSTGRAADRTERDRVMPGCDRTPTKSMFSASTGSRTTKLSTAPLLPYSNRCLREARPSCSLTRCCWIANFMGNIGSKTRVLRDY